MTKYVLKRVVYAFLTIVVLVAITFALMQLLPGDPFIGDKAMSEATKAALMAKYGFDKPVWQQFFIYLGNVFTGDLGTSAVSNRPVTTIILESFPYSFDLGIRSLIFATVIGVFLGSTAAIRRGKTADTVAMMISVIGVSVPSFIVAAVLQYFLGLKLGLALGTFIFPISGYSSEMHKILPALSLSLGTLATVSRLMRTSMLDVLGSDYIKTAKAKGLSQRTILYRHALRNAAMPVLTVLGPLAAAILTGGFVVEQIFAIPGMGRLFVTSIQSVDYQVIVGTTIFYGAFLIIATLIIDILYGVVDPRVDLSK